MKGRHSRTVTTAFGGIALSRPYVVASGEGSFPADEHLGIGGFLTTAAKRLVTLVGVAKSFVQAERLLAELCGWSVDPETIRRTTHAAAKAIAASRPSRADAGRSRRRRVRLKWRSTRER